MKPIQRISRFGRDDPLTELTAQLWERHGRKDAASLIRQFGINPNPNLGRTKSDQTYQNNLELAKCKLEFDKATANGTPGDKAFAEYIAPTAKRFGVSADHIRNSRNKNVADIVRRLKDDEGTSNNG